MNGSDVIQGEIVKLRPLAKDDLPQLAEWRNWHRQWFIDSRNVTWEGQEAWFSQYQQRLGDFMYIIETSDGRAVGALAIYNIDQKSRTAEFGRLMIGSHTDQGRGYSADATRTLLRYASGQLGIRHVFLQVLDGNRAAISLYQALGFRPDSSHDAYLERQGELVRLIGMSISLT
jgi:RimJ/RimL family protein N-acetyltransferase